LNLESGLLVDQPPSSLVPIWTHFPGHFYSHTHTYSHNLDTLTCVWNVFFIFTSFKISTSSVFFLSACVAFRVSLQSNPKLIGGHRYFLVQPCSYSILGLFCSPIMRVDANHVLTLSCMRKSIILRIQFYGTCSILYAFPLCFYFVPGCPAYVLKDK
jgi:hypothetical protein